MRAAAMLCVFLALAAVPPPPVCAWPSGQTCATVRAVYHADPQPGAADLWLFELVLRDGTVRFVRSPRRTAAPGETVCIKLRRARDGGWDAVER